MRIEARPCAVYRHFDEWGTLLYIGSSVAPDARDRSHIDGAEWLPFARRGSIEWFPSVERAAVVEALAIRAEHPVFNRAHAVGDPGQRIADYHARRAAAAVMPDFRPTPRPLPTEGLVTLTEAALALGLQGPSGLKRLRNAHDRSPLFPAPREGGGRGQVGRYDLDELRTWLAASQQSQSVIEGNAK